MLLLGSSGAEAARGTSHLMLPPTSRNISTPLTPHTNPTGGAGTGQALALYPAIQACLLSTPMPRYHR
jgi:hypothetical protein